MTLEEKVGQMLINQKKTLSLAESCTGGLLSHRLTNIPGSSNFLKTGIVSYSNDAKIKLLKVPEKIILASGAVSENVALAMAHGARKLFDTDFGVGITGIAGPTGASKSKPIGLTYIAIKSKGEALCIKSQFCGSRTQIKQKAATQALRLIQKFLL